MKRRIEAASGGVSNSVHDGPLSDGSQRKVLGDCSIETGRSTQAVSAWVVGRRERRTAGLWPAARCP